MAAPATSAKKKVSASFFASMAGDHKSQAFKDQGAVSTLKRSSTGRAYIIARLERDG